MKANRLPKGLTKSAAGWRISLGKHGGAYSKRFKPSTSRDVVEQELLKARRVWKANRPDDEETLEADVTRYLADYFTGRSAQWEADYYLKLWTKALGPDTPRDDVTTDAIARTLQRWRADGYAADTCNKRRTTLLSFYNRLNGKSGYNPVRDVPKFRPPDPLPRGLAYHLIEKALKTMSACKTRARLRVIAYTGMRPGQVMKLTPEHWDHRQHVLTVPGTTKGRGTKPYNVPLSERATAALKEFDAIDAWGSFRVSPLGRMWKAAAAKAKIPDGTVPYDLRHSFGTAVYQATGDLHAARKLLGHSSIQMTERYTLAAVPAQQIAAVKAFDTFTRRRLPVKLPLSLKDSGKKRKR